MTTPQTPRWYSVNNIGMATLCADKADAEDVARTCDIDFPRQSPHRAVQLVEVSGCGIGRDEIVIMALEAGFAHSWSEAAGEALERFATQATAKERTARIAAQVENEALRAELAKARTPLEDYEWLEYILRNGSKSDVHIATHEGVATTGPRGKIIRLQHDANNLRKLVEAAYGIGEKP